MRTDPRVRTGALVLMALAGLAVAVALAVAVNSLSTQHIGLAGEPLRAGETLAPIVQPTRTTTRRKKRHAATGAATTTTTTGATGPATQPAPATGGSEAAEHERPGHDSDDD